MAGKIHKRFEGFRRKPKEPSNPTSDDTGANPGGYNILNVDARVYSPRLFWEAYNEPWLDAAISRGDRIALATPPTEAIIFKSQGLFGGFGKEYYYLLRHGYEFDQDTGTLVLNKTGNAETFAVIGEQRPSALPEKDFLYATEFHSPTDFRYELAETFINAVEIEIGERPFNCKIELLHDIYNVYVYFDDINKVPWKQGVPLPVPVMDKENAYAAQLKALFEEALSRHPVEQLNAMQMNKNGVFLLDLAICARAYTLYEADEAVFDYLASQHPVITLAIRNDTTYYLFFQQAAAMASYREADTVDKLKDSLRSIISRHDTNGVWADEEPQIILDDFANIEKIGVHHYLS